MIAESISSDHSGIWMENEPIELTWIVNENNSWLDGNLFWFFNGGGDIGASLGSES